MKKKIIALIVAGLLFLSIACNIENEDWRMIEDARQNTAQMEQP